MADRVGQRLGNYRLIRLLGRGGFAEVYLGEHLRLGIRAAVKVLNAHLANPTDVESFEKEARTIAHLHPHIVRVFDFDVQDDIPFLVMDYAPGGTLRQRHPKGSILPLPVIVSNIKQAAEALQYAHDQRLIHRDVKPENMLLGQHDEVLLSDFGLATIAQHSSSQSIQNIAGTVIYMAPEQVQGKPRPVSDQYALGIVVYEWLSGNYPFNGTATEIAIQHVQAPVPSLRQHGYTISLDVEQVIITALAKDPRQRFSSVRAFATALEQASQLAGPRYPVPSQSPTVPDQLRYSAQKGAPTTPLSERTLTSTTGEGAGISVTSPNQSKQPGNNSEVQSTFKPTHQGISRRAVVLGLGAAGLAIAGGSLSWLVKSGALFTPYSTFTPTPHATPTLPPISLGKLLYTYRGHPNWVIAVAWSPDSKRIVSGGGGFIVGDHTVQVWDASDGGDVYIYHGHSGDVDAVAWSPDSRRIASGSLDSTVQVWGAG